MAIDILTIKPNVISKDINGKFVLLYGAPKIGKTTAAAQFPKTLLLAFEKGYNALAGVKPQDISKWSEFKLVIRQLRRPEAKELYSTIAIDTVSMAYTLCEEFVCIQNGVSSISEIPWGAGWSMVRKEFESCLREITLMGYGLVLIAHEEKKEVTQADNSVVVKVSPQLPKRAAEICNGLVDVMGYIGLEWNGESKKRWLYTRSTPNILAGSRFKYLAPKIEFGYEQLVNAIAEAITKEEQEDGIVTTERTETPQQKEGRSYEEVLAEAKELWQQLIDKDEGNAKKVLDITEKVFGKPTRLSEITEKQKDLFELAILGMKDLL